MNFTVKHIRTGELLTITISGNTPQKRFDSINEALKPYSMYFGCSVRLYTFDTDEHIADLVTDPDELSDYLFNW